MASYKNVDDNLVSRELKIQVDTKIDATLFPIFDIMVLVHATTIQGVTSHQNKGNS